MVKLQEIVAYIEGFAPLGLAEAYDNPGLLVAGKTEEIERIFLCLDVDEAAVLEAEGRGAQLILSHHPLMFRGINHLTEQTGEERTLRRLVEKGIALYAAHTNLDSAEGGMCDGLISDLELSEASRRSFSGGAFGIGRLVELKASIPLKDLAKQIQKKLKLKDVPFVGDPSKPIRKLAVCNGGGGDLVYEAFSLGADAYLSGDFKYHQARFAFENHMGLLSVGHHDAEARVFTVLVERLLKQAFESKLEISSQQDNQDIWQSVL